MPSAAQPPIGRPPSRRAALAAALGLWGLAGTAVADGPRAVRALPVEGTLPSLAGATDWIGSAPLTAEALRGKVVLLNVWTYTCINSLRPLPYVRAWAEKYRASGLVVIGIHAPEFSFERLTPNVRRFSQALDIRYPVAVDSRLAIWSALDNRYWPAFYFADAQGRIRYHRFGEGAYDDSEKVIQQLLAETGGTEVPSGLVVPRGEGVQAGAGPIPAASEETYFGYARATGFASRGGLVRDRAHDYEPALLHRTDEWSLQGGWTITGESADLDRAGGRIAFRFRARDLHMVLGSRDGRPLPFRVLVDGRLPAEDHGTDIDDQGRGRIDGQRLYQLIRQARSPAERIVEITFDEPMAQVYVVTFG